MATFVLIHGAWHGAWCWYRVAPALERHGHRVLAPDLPAHGSDTTPAAAVTFRDCVDRIGASLGQARSLDAAPLLLVGHSLAGVFITQAAEDWPERVDRLVYVAAFLPADGQSVLDLSAADPDSAVTASSVLSPDQATVTLRPDRLAGLFYGDCDPGDVAVATRLQVPEPLAPFGTPVAVTADRAGRVPRAYIRTARDAAITPARQDAMLQAVPCDPVLTVDTGHSPFLADPDGLARLLHGLARNGGTSWPPAH